MQGVVKSQDKYVAHCVKRSAMDCLVLVRKDSILHPASVLLRPFQHRCADVRSTQGSSNQSDIDYGALPFIQARNQNTREQASACMHVDDTMNVRVCNT
jgi:hypothetical protein